MTENPHFPPVGNMDAVQAPAIGNSDALHLSLGSRLLWKHFPRVFCLVLGQFFHNLGVWRPKVSW